MFSPSIRPETPAQVLPVIAARSVTAVDGANLGDAISVADELIPGDTYHLAAAAQRLALAVVHDRESGGFRIAPSSEVGRPGALLPIDCIATVMSPDGATLELLILVELAADGTIADVYLFPLAEMAPRVDYSIVTIDRDAGRARFAETACVAFTAGTRITLASGAQVPIESLSVGDRVLTRDHGVQPIRWIGHQTVRALGAFAPIRIRAGTLHNEGDLVVSPNHRLFVYQRRDTVGAGRAEVLVRARHLLNDETVTRTSGGFVDYYRMLFDRHEIVYAEGIAAETLIVDQTTRAALPDEITRAIRDEDAPETAIEIGERHLGHRAVELLRQASVG